MNNEVISIEYKGDIIGTGFFIAHNMIMTCQHVVQTHKKLKAVIYYPHKKVIMDLIKIYVNKKLDYALYAIPEKVENVLPMHHSRDLQPGTPFRIECPHSKPPIKELALSVNSGMYSDDLYNISFVNIGAVCLPGTSGSPLLNLDRQIVGLHWASGLGRYRHSTFSVPIDLIKMDMVIKKDLITRKLLGLSSIC